MAVTMADISKLRTMTGAGMMDCKKALEEAGNDFDKAIEIIRKKGQAIAANQFPGYHCKISDHKNCQALPAGDRNCRP